MLAPIQSFGAPDLRSYPTPSGELLSPQARKHRREKGHEQLASIFYSEAQVAKKATGHSGLLEGPKEAAYSNGTGRSSHVSLAAPFYNS